MTDIEGVCIVYVCYFYYLMLLNNHRYALWHTKIPLCIHACLAASMHSIWKIILVFLPLLYVIENTIIFTRKNSRVQGLDRDYVECWSTRLSFEVFHYFSNNWANTVQVKTHFSRRINTISICRAWCPNYIWITFKYSSPCNIFAILAPRVWFRSCCYPIFSDKIF